MIEEQYEPEDTSGIAPEQLNYEQARDELVMTVRDLESGQIPLDQAMQKWERGEALAERCQTILDAARTRIDERTGKNDSNN